jgi:hypothetical protein
MKEMIMKHKLRVMVGVGLIALVGSSVFCSQSNSHTGGGASFSGMQQETVVDPAYGMTAFTIPIPSGWKFAGMILRPGGCHPPPTPAAGLSYTAMSPDGREAMITLPGVSWTWSSNGTNIMGPKCPSTIDINTAAGLLLNIAVPNLHPDAKKVTLVPLKQADLDALAAQNQKLAAGLRGYGLKGSKQFVDGARVRIEYERRGQQMEEIEFTLIDCLESPVMGMPMGNGRWSKGYTKRTCSSRGTMIKRAPKGQLDALIANSKPLQVNPEWDQRVIHDMQTMFQQMQAASNREFQQNMANFKAQGDARLAAGQAFQQNLRESTTRAMDNDRARQDAMHESAQKMELYSLDQQQFRDPNTGQIVQASNQYNHQWMSSDGSTLIQTNDHTLDPNGVVYPVSQSWTELVPK